MTSLSPIIEAIQPHISEKNKAFSKAESKS